MTGDAELPLVGKKLMSKLGAMANENAAAEMSDFALRQMKKMGWSAGKGLGKNEQGVKSHVKVKRREELRGVGAEKQEAKEQQNQWWYNVYDRMASKIVVNASSDEEDAEKKRKKNKVSKREKKRKREGVKEQKFRIPTDEELFAATGGKLFGRRAYGTCNGKLQRDEMQLKKLKRQESGEPATTSSGSDSIETKSEREQARKKDRKRKQSKKEKKSKKDTRE